MRTIHSTLTSKGQVTLPSEVRRHLGVAAHDKLAFVIDDDGTVRVETVLYPTLESIRGAAGSLKHPLSWDEVMHIAHEDHVASMISSDE
ncbi:MAG: AbrB/MazE/SpoVT family DNA-binding domain-containing protein [Thermomicrobiales bacterium]